MKTERLHNFTDIHKGAVLNLRFTADGSYLMSAGQDRNLWLLNPHNGRKVKGFCDKHNKEVNDLAIFQDNAKFISVSGDKFGFMWDVSTGNILQKFKGHDGRINCCTFAGSLLHGDSEALFLTGSYDRKIHIWDVKGNRRGRPVQELTEARDSVSCLLATDRYIISGSIDGAVRMYDLRKGEVCSDQYKIPISSVSLSKDGNIMLVSVLRSTHYMVDLSLQASLASFKGHRNESYKIMSQFDNTNTRVISGSEDGRLYTWNISDDKTPESIFHLNEGRLDTNCFSVRCHPKQNLVAAGIGGGVSILNLTGEM